jgi:hypothetical protein
MFIVNERIKELAEQAFQPINDMSTEGVADRWTFEQPWFQMYSQSLAQLIVQECCDIADVVECADMDSFVSKYIKAYFEIKE